MQIQRYLPKISTATAYSTTSLNWISIATNSNKTNYCCKNKSYNQHKPQKTDLKCTFKEQNEYVFFPPHAIFCTQFVTASHTAPALLQKVR